MMNLKNLDLLGLQTAYMRRDLITQATCYALEPFWISLSEVIDMVLVLPMIDHLPEAALDELAWQYHVDAYDATAAPAEKRRMIKAALRFISTRAAYMPLNSWWTACLARRQISSNGSITMGSHIISRLRSTVLTVEQGKLISAVRNSLSRRGKICARFWMRSGWF